MEEKSLIDQKLIETYRKLPLEEPAFVDNIIKADAAGKDSEVLVAMRTLFDQQDSGAIVNETDLKPREFTHLKRKSIYRLYHKKLSDVKELENKLRQDVELKQASLKVMEGVLREKEENLQVHESKLYELKRMYDQKLGSLNIKEDEINKRARDLEIRFKDHERQKLDFDNHHRKKTHEIINLQHDQERLLKQRHADLFSKVGELEKNLARHAQEKFRIDQEIARCALQKKMVDEQLSHRKLQVDEIIRREKELAKELERKQRLVSVRDQTFEKTHKRQADLDQQLKHAEQTLSGLNLEIKQKQVQVQKLQQQLSRHHEVAQSADNRKVGEIYTLKKQIFGSLSRSDIDNARSSYERLRDVYRNLEDQNKAKVYDDLLEVKQRLDSVLNA